MDESLVASEYDAVIVGTGMVESILAGALARVGKKVLHLDENDYYGSHYATLQLDQLLRWAQTGQESTPEADVLSSLSSSEQYVPLHNSFRGEVMSLRFASEAIEQQLRDRSCHFNLDVNPRLILSNDLLVSLLIQSGVGRYLEFNAMEKTLMQFPPSQTKPSTSFKAFGSSALKEEDTVHEVPCSKKAIFSSTWLTMVEKRLLMKFLQFVADYGETFLVKTDVLTQNERELALGRSLKRPQNKQNTSVVCTDSSTGSHKNKSSASTSEEVATYDTTPFGDFLKQKFKLSDKLQQVVLYCVALATFDTSSGQMSTTKGLQAVFRYVSSLGKFTMAAFLCPLYGASEIAQGFCRLSAVYGGIYVLRSPVESLVIAHEPAQEGEHEQTDEEQAIKKPKQRVVGVRCRDGHVVKAKQVVLSAGYSNPNQSKAPSAQLLRGIFILSCSLWKQSDNNRLFMVIPPKDATLGNDFAIQVLQLDASTYSCPKGYFVVQISTPLADPHDGESSEQARLKALALMQGVVQHLLGKELKHDEQQHQQQQEQEVKDNEASKLSPESASLAESETNEDQPDAPVSTENGQEVVQEAKLPRVMFEMVFTIPFYGYEEDEEQDEELQTLQNPFENVTVCEQSRRRLLPLQLTLEKPTLNAKKVFERLCPGEDFLPKSASAEQAEKDELEDEQEAILSAATQFLEKEKAKESEHSDSSQDVAASTEETIVGSHQSHENPEESQPSPSEHAAPADDLAALQTSPSV